jgi:hypothetical protein
LEVARLLFMHHHHRVAWKLFYSTDRTSFCTKWAHTYFLFKTAFLWTPFSVIMLSDLKLPVSLFLWENIRISSGLIQSPWQNQMKSSV